MFLALQKLEFSIPQQSILTLKVFQRSETKIYITTTWHVFHTNCILVKLSTRRK